MKKKLFEKSGIPVSVLLFFVLISGALKAGNKNNPAEIDSRNLTNFTISTTPTAETCLGNGSVSILINNTVTGASLEFSLYKFPNLSTPIVPIFNNVTSGNNYTQVINGLQSGNYRVIVKETDANGATTTKQADFTIANNIVNVAFTVSQTQSCAGYTLTTNVTAGNPAYYKLLNATTLAVIVPNQTSNVFPNLSPGTYRVVVTNTCGNETVKDYTIANTPYTAVVTFYTNSFRDVYVDGNCNTSTYTPTISGNVAYPISITIDVVHGSTITSYTQTATSSTTIPTFTLVHYSDTTTYNVKITDACGTVFTFTRLENANPVFDLVGVTSSCGKRYLKIDGFNEWGKMLNVTFTAYPAGFDPANYNSNFAPGTYSLNVTNIGVVSTLVNIGNATLPVPEGTYTVVVTDECGNTYTRTLTLAYAASLLRAVREYPGCDSDVSSIYIIPSASGTSGQTSDITHIEVTSAPAAFISAYGPLPYDVSYNIISGGFRMANLPAGNYTFSAQTTCGDLSNTFTLRPVVATLDSYTVTPNCGSFNLSATFTANVGSKLLTLQRYDETTGQWVHPINGTPIGASNIGLALNTTTNGSTLQTLSVTQNNITGTGKFRLSIYGTVYTDGNSTSAATARCLYLTKDFTYFNNPKINNYYVFQCSNGKINIVIDAQGKDPLSFEIIAKNGDSSFYINNGSNPVFVNLDSAQYTVKVTDDCGNSFVINIDGTTTKLPKIKAYKLCDGQNGGYLYLPGLSFMTIEWYKQPNLTTSIGTGNYLYFNPYTESTDAGTYVAHLRYLSNPGACLDQYLTFTLTPGNSTNPKAGTGQTVTIYSTQITQFVDLFDYLTGPYDNYGTWTELTTSNLQTGNEWYGQYATTGTYTFEYSVEGICSGVDTTTVTINLVTHCLNDPNTSSTGIETNHGISLLKRAGDYQSVAVDNQWPMIRKSAHTVLESNTKGFVITRMNTAQISALTAQDGMMVYDTDAKCLKIYTVDEVTPANSAWHCFNTAACP